MAAIARTAQSVPARAPAMAPYPHHYRVAAAAAPEGEVILLGEGLEPLSSAPPAEFGGPGDRWSPETLLLGALGDCFVLTFRAVARKSGLAWSSLEVGVDGTLERRDGRTLFTSYVLHARLVLPFGGDPEAGEAAAHQAAHACLISNSLVGSHTLDVQVAVVA